VIADLETRLADVIGADLPAPFGGHVSVAPGPPGGANPTVVVGTTAFEVLEPDFGSRARPELAPPVTDPRRVVRMRCSLSVEVRPSTGQGRAQQLAGLDALLYLLDGPTFQSGEALVDGTDRGFLLDGLRVVDGRAEADPAIPGGPPMVLDLEAVGWFWPPGTPGATGPTIVEVRVRGLDLPMSAAVPPIVAGGAPVVIAFSFGAGGPLRVSAPGSAALPALPFGSLALRLLGRAGAPGAGALSGGTAAADGTTLVPVTGGRAGVTYTPPASPAEDSLVVAVDDGADGAGMEITRVPIRVGAS